MSYFTYLGVREGGELLEVDEELMDCRFVRPTFAVTPSRVTK